VAIIIISAGVDIVPLKQEVNYCLMPPLTTHKSGVRRPLVCGIMSARWNTIFKVPKERMSAQAPMKIPIPSL